MSMRDIVRTTARHRRVGRGAAAPCRQFETYFIIANTHTRILESIRALRYWAIYSSTTNAKCTKPFTCASLVVGRRVAAFGAKCVPRRSPAPAGHAFCSSGNYGRVRTCQSVRSHCMVWHNNSSRAAIPRIWVSGECVREFSI